MTTTRYRLIWLILALGLVASSTWAVPLGCNTDQTWPLRTTELYWEWLPVAAVPDEWVIRVGLHAGQYTLPAKRVPGTQMSIPLTEIISVEQFQKDLAAIGPNATRVVYYSQMWPIIEGQEGEASPTCFFALGTGVVRPFPAVTLGVRSLR